MCSVYKHTVNPCCLCSSCSQRNKHTLTNTQSIIWEIWHHWCKDPVNNRRLVLAASVFSEQHASCHILTEKNKGIWVHTGWLCVPCHPILFSVYSGDVRSVFFICPLKNMECNMKENNKNNASRQCTVCTSQHDIRNVGKNPIEREYSSHKPNRCIIFAFELIFLVTCWI